MKNILNIDDLQNMAKKRVPKMFYEYADSGSWSGETYKANQNDFSNIKFRQRVGVNIENRILSSHRLIKSAIRVIQIRKPLLNFFKR